MTSLIASGLETTAIPRAGNRAWKKLRSHRSALFGFGIVFFFVIVAVLAPLLPIPGPTATDWAAIRKAPSLVHWLGTDDLGRDELSRMIWGAQASLLAGVVSVLITIVIAVPTGLVAGYFGGVVDQFLSRLMDLLLAFPLLLFAIALVAVLGDYKFLFLSADTTRVFMLVVIIGFFNWPYIGRIIRGQTLSLREKEYVEAARSLGAGNTRILFRELLPNLVGPILVYSTLIIPTNILFEAALSFLGVGVRIPNPSWGGMLSDAVQYYQIDPMFMFVPGLAIFVTVMAFNLFGDGLRDALDPRSNR